LHVADREDESYLRADAADPRAEAADAIAGTTICSIARPRYSAADSPCVLRNPIARRVDLVEPINIPE